MTDTPHDALAQPRRMEIESKFEIPDERTFERLRALETIGDYTLSPCGEQDVVDVYLDTANRDLLHAGWGCRIRDGIRPGRALVTVKSLGRVHGAVHRRHEHEIEIASGLAPGSWPPGAVRDLVTEAAHGRALVPLLTLWQERTLHDVRRGKRAVAVRFLDRVHLQSGDRTTTVLELEIELAGEGTVADLQDLEQALRTFDLRAHSRSKLERALAWIESTGTTSANPSVSPKPSASPPAAAPKKKRKGPAVRADEPFAEAGRKILAYHCERMLQHEDGTRAGVDPEELHDMRVATRRQRAALRIVQPYMRRKALEPVREGLRAAATVLGAVRDLDVLREGMQAYRQSLEAEEMLALQPLYDAWSARRDSARDAMLVHLDGAEWTAFKREYERFLASPGEGVLPASDGEVPRAHLVAHVLPGEVWRHYGAVRAYESVLPWAATETLHALRIECKRLRYVLEFFQETLDPEVETAIGAMVKLQDHLGELNDSHVTIGLIREFLAGSYNVARPTVGVAAGRYLEFHMDRVHRLRREVDAPWRGVASAEFKQILARAVAVL